MADDKAPLKLEPLPFEEAIKSAELRDVVLPDTYYGKLQGIERAEAFSVAGMAELDQLQQTLDSLTTALANGNTYEEWRKELLTAPEALQLPAHRLDNIFRTNLQGAYARGRCAHISRNKDRRPYLMYSAINDDRTRPHHLAMHGHVAPVDDPVWSTWTPPAGYRCRCTVINIDEEQAAARRKRDEENLSKNPDRAQERTNAISDGPDEGWDYTPCEGIEKQAHAIATEKAKTLHQALNAKIDAIQQEADRIRNVDDFDAWERTGDQLGSNHGGIYTDPDGNEWYVKIYDDAAQAKSEFASHKIIEQITGSAPKVKLLQHNGKTVYASEWIEGLEKLDPEQYAKLKLQLADHYAAASLLKNWDVVGAARDNLLITKDGRLIMIDAGGAMKFRAQGGPKVFAGGPVDELHSLLNPNYDAGKVFTAIPERNRNAAIRRLEELTKTSIRESFEAAGYTAAEVKEMTEIVWSRKKWMLEAVKNKQAAAKMRPGKYTPEEADRVLQKVLDEAEDYEFGGLRRQRDPSGKFVGDGNTQRRWSREEAPYLSAVRSYTTGDYEHINPPLRGEFPSKAIEAFAEVAQQGLDLNKKFTGTTTRGAFDSIEEARGWIEGHKKALKTGRPVRYSGFLSTDTKGGWRGSVKIEIEANGLQGVDIRHISASAREDEVLFGHGSQFRVKSIEERKDEMGRPQIWIFLKEEQSAIDVKRPIRLAAPKD